MNRKNYNKEFVCIIMGFVVLGAAVCSLSAQENKTQKALEIHGQGIELWRQGNFTDAADKFREAIKIDDTNASIYYDLGKLLMDELKDTDNAIDAFTLSYRQHMKSTIGELIIISVKPTQKRKIV